MKDRYDSIKTGMEYDSDSENKFTVSNDVFERSDFKSKFPVPDEDENELKLEENISLDSQEISFEDTGDENYYPLDCAEEKKNQPVIDLLKRYLADER